MLCGLATSHAQGFFNLTAEQVKIDSLLPCFTYVHDLGVNYADSNYSVSIDYPEFMPMSDTDIKRYHRVTTDTLPAMPVVNSSIGVSRKRGQLDVSFVPLVYRDGKYQKLVSFKLTIKSQPLQRSAKLARKATAASSRYADHSVLRSGDWAKIRVSQSGVYQLTESLIRQAGFTDMSKVKIYGYGGALQPESLNGSYLTSTDDLNEVPTCTVGGKRLFYAQGPVTWSANATRTRNPYSDYGYYFITESEGTPSTVDSTAFLSSFYPAGEDYNTLYEVDDYAWFHGGRNLYDSKVLGVGTANAYTLASAGTSSAGVVRVVLSAYLTSGTSVASVSVNDSVVGNVTVRAVSSVDYDSGQSGEAYFSVGNLQPTNTVTITQSSGGTMRLDYIAIRNTEPKAAPALATAQFPVPEYVYRITNQDHHADSAVDMVIIVPTSQTFVSQAERLKALHEQYDGISVRIVPADELYNEFSSGTPDATAYRRYLKMFYDRAETDADIPSYLLLFGDGAWDNRMLSSEWRGYSPDDFLLCFESENSFSKINCFVSDDFYCMLDDNERIYSSSNYSGKPDVAVGRLSARNASQAKVMVDKIESYMTNAETGSWKNTVVVMGDDGNNNSHMEAANIVAGVIEDLQPAMDVKRVMWDAYPRTTSSTGFQYPDVEKLVKQYMDDGALLFNYNGHGKETTISHEVVLTISDFIDNKCSKLPLWVTASCDITPFDSQTDNIGEAAMYNENGGAVAFYGTTRTVYTSYNLKMNRLFTKYLFSQQDGKRISMGEAARLAKVELVSQGSTQGDLSSNKLHYVLLGDPALVLSYPETAMAVDSINGVCLSSADSALTLKAGQVVRVAGHVEANGTMDNTFNGLLKATVYDASQQIVCRLNNTSTSDGSQVAFTYYDRQNSVYAGSDSVCKGRFSFSFVVPKDISYSDGNGRMVLYAVNSDNTRETSGETEAFIFNGTSELKRDSVGPNIYCYLNSSSFSNGDRVNSTPYFYAEISDEDGINASGSGIGHDMQLTIDGEMSKTYVLNNYFSFDFGSYKSGTVGYSIPELALGQHKLSFRAWDVMNNPSTVELSFSVADGVAPGLVDIDCTKNPATTTTSFRIIHDRMGSNLDAKVEVFDMSGRRLWCHTESAEQTSNVMTVDWDLTTDSGQQLNTGVYLYRVSVSAGGEGSSKTKKLIVLSNK